MPVLAQFDPQGKPGEAADAFVEGRNASENWMDRAQNRQINQERLDDARRKSALDELERPVKEAELKAKIIGLGASVANQTRMEQLKGQAAAQSHDANNEFLDAMQLADFNSKATALAGLQAKYQWMSLIPEYKGFVDTINDERVKAHGSAIADAHMEQQLEASRNAQDRAIEVANIAAGSRENVAAANADSRETVADTNAKAKLATDTSRTTNSEKNRESRVTLAKVHGFQQSAIQADKDAAKALGAGDEDTAAMYQKHAKEYRDQADKLTAQDVEAVNFNVPGSNPDGTDTPAQEDAPKLYTPPAQPGESPSFSPAVKKPEDVLKSVQQMLDDGQITEEQARDTLTKLGFKRKGK